MGNSWVGIALPFGMIGFWLAVVIVELITTPTPPRDTGYRSNRTTA